MLKGLLRRGLVLLLLAVCLCDCSDNDQDCLPAGQPCSESVPCCGGARTITTRDSLGRVESSSCVCVDEEGDVPCEPTCLGRECGSDGCGGTCGPPCPDGEQCQDGLCECTPDCNGRDCGPDPVCGTECGECSDDEICNADGICECIPDCGGSECGLDPICGTLDCGACTGNDTCNSDGTCECVADCGSRECGLDPVCETEDCGSCRDNEICSSEGHCTCIPDCDGRVCGLDGCGDVCGPGCELGQGCDAVGQCRDLEYGPEGPSCADLSGTECNGESCCASIVLPGSTYPMGRESEVCSGCTDGCPLGMICDSEEQPEHPATVSRFALDKYEVTLGRFAAFVDAYDGGWRPSVGEGANVAVETAQELAAGATGWQSAWQTELPADRAELADNITCSGLQTPQDPTWGMGDDADPMNCVNWYEAFVFCIWDGGRLPTEAEWEYAAAGGDENRVYPWGNDVTIPLPAAYAGTDETPFIAVGTHPVGNGRWGHADLAGSMWEWVFDGYRANWYATTVDGCSDCAQLSSIVYRVMRGGSWAYSTPTSLRAAHRDSGAPDFHWHDHGWRCSRSAP